MKTIKKLINLNERLNTMVEEIMIYKGYVNFSEMARAAIMNLHADVMRESGKMYGGGKKDTPSLAKQKKEEEEREQREKLLICDQLNGTVEQKADGSAVCVYYTYVGRKRYEQRVSVGLLEKNMINNQYTPSKKAVEELQAKGEVDYETEKSKRK